MRNPDQREKWSVGSSGAHNYKVCSLLRIFFSVVWRRVVIGISFIFIWDEGDEWKKNSENWSPWNACTHNIKRKLQQNKWKRNNTKRNSFSLKGRFNLLYSMVLYCTPRRTKPHLIPPFFFFVLSLVGTRCHQASFIDCQRREFDSFSYVYNSRV